MAFTGFTEGVDVTDSGVDIIGCGLSSVLPGGSGMCIFGSALS